MRRTNRQVEGPQVSETTGESGARIERIGCQTIVIPQDCPVLCWNGFFFRGLHDRTDIFYESTGSTCDTRVGFSGRRAALCRVRWSGHYYIGELRGVRGLRAWATIRIKSTGEFKLIEKHVDDVEPIGPVVGWLTRRCSAFSCFDDLMRSARVNAYRPSLNCADPLNVLLANAFDGTTRRFPGSYQYANGERLVAYRWGRDKRARDGGAR